MKTRNISSLIFGTGIGIFFYKFLNYNLLLSILIGLGSFIIISKILKAIIKKITDTGVPEVTPVSKQAAEISEEGMKKLRKIRNQTRLIKNNEAAQKIQNICRIGVEIFDDLKNNPGDIKRAKPFTNYYLDSTEKIVTRYVDLSSRKDITPDVEKALKRVEDLLDSIKETFEKQLANLLEDDLLDLNTELSVLEKTIKFEG